MNETRRKVLYKEFETTQEGYCLLITGGMMSPPIAIIERHDGTLTEIPIEKIQFLDSDAFMQNRRCEDCPDGCPVETPKAGIVTNANRIRSMSDEELAEFLRNIRDCGDYEELKFIGGVCMDYVSVIEWLKQPAKEE